MPDLRSVLIEIFQQAPRWRHKIPRRVWDDLIHDVVVEALEHEGTIAPESCGSWFRRALQRRIIDSMRAHAEEREQMPFMEAHLRARGSPFPSPDATTARRELFEAVAWLLGQVDPGRREAAGWYIWRALQDDDVSVDALAQELGMERGTLASRWARSKAEMEAAVQRERARGGGRSKLAALLAFLAAVWAWLAGRGRDASGSSALAGLLGQKPRESPGPASGGAPSSANPRAPRGRESWPPSRRIAQGAALCAALALAVYAHYRVAPSAWTSVSMAISSAAATSSSDGDEAQPNTNDHLLFAPFLQTNAEREREAGSAIERRPLAFDPPADSPLAVGSLRNGPAAPSPQKGNDPGIGAQKVAQAQAPAASAIPAPRIEAARAHLVAAQQALFDRKDRTTARELLQLYELTFPEDPFPKKHAELIAALR